MIRQEPSLQTSVRSGVMPAAGYGDVASSGQSADDGADDVLDPIPPAGRCRLLGLFNVLFIDIHGLLFGEVLKESHGSKARDREFRVVRSRECTAPSLGVDGLNGQLNRLNPFSCPIRLREWIITQHVT